MSGARNDGLLRVLAAIVATEGDRTVAEISKAADITPKQAREHLQALQARDLVRGSGAPQVPGRRGPPGYVYRWEPRR